MTRSGARLLVVLGAIGVLALSTLSVAVVGGHLGGPTRALATCGPSNPRGSIVNVTLSDRGGAMMGANSMMVALGASPDVVAAGTVTFIATNVGALNHELLVLPATPDGVGTRALGPGGTIDESASLGEASTTCGEGHGAGISPGTSSWVTLELPRGSYELLCDVPWHYANGMFAPLSVH